MTFLPAEWGGRISRKLRLVTFHLVDSVCHRLIARPSFISKTLFVQKHVMLHRELHLHYTDMFGQLFLAHCCVGHQGSLHISILELHILGLRAEFV